MRDCTQPVPTYTFVSWASPLNMLVVTMAPAVFSVQLLATIVVILEQFWNIDVMSVTIDTLSWATSISGGGSSWRT